MVVEHIFSSIRLILNKNRRGFVKTTDISTAVKLAINDIFSEGLKIYRESGIISAEVKRFVKTTSVTLTEGVGDLPADFVKEVNFVTNTEKEGTFVDPEEFEDRKSSLILQPDEDNPIGKIEDNQLFVDPIDYPSIDFIHFRTPVDFVYATTIAGDGRSESFNEAGSTDVEFNVTFSGGIIRRALVYLGIANQNMEAATLGAIDKV